MENDLLNIFSEIQAILKFIEKPLTARQISKKFNLSALETRELLDRFIQQGDTLQQYLFVFTADVKTNKGLESMLIPSYSEQLEDVINDPGLLDLSVYAVWRKLPIVDYSCLYNEPEIMNILEVGKSGLSAPVKQFGNISLKEQKKPPHKEVIEFKSNIQEVKGEEGEYYYGEPVKQAANNIETCNTNLAKTDSVEPDMPYQSIQTKIDIEQKGKKRKTSEDSSSESVSLKRRKESDSSSGEPKKVLKTKKVKQTKSYVDEKGYLHTIDEWVDEEYWAEEKTAAPINLKPSNNDIKSKKAPAGQQNKKPNNQASLHSFFKK
jgi:hypothetical protein